MAANQPDAREDGVMARNLFPSAHNHGKATGMGLYPAYCYIWPEITFSLFKLRRRLVALVSGAWWR